MVTTWYNNWQFWEDYPNQKVAFDGPTKTIFVNEGVTELDVRVDLYSAWKEWIIISPEAPNPAAWPVALSATGGDPITATQNLGVTYFLENGWRIQPYNSSSPYLLNVVGNIYTREAGENPFLFAQGASVSLARSNLVDQIEVGGGSGGDSAEAIAAAVWAALNRTLTSGEAPSVVQIREEMDANSTKLDEIKTQTTDIPTVQEIWSADINTDYGTNSIGNWMRTKLLTVAKFIGLR